MPSQKQLFSVLFFSLLLSFVLYNDAFNTLDTYKSSERKYGNCQSLIVGRFLVSENEQIFNYAGLPGQYNFNRTWGICSDRKNYEYYSQQRSSGNYRFETYLSQIGGNGMAQETIEKSLPFSKESNYNILQFLQTFLLSLSVVLILFQFYRNFGLLAALIPYLLLAVSTWFVYLSTNIWFSIWTYFLPLVFFYFYVEKHIRKQTKINMGKLFAWVVFILFIKVFLTGFEFITTILITSIIPLFYYYFYVDFHQNKKSQIFKYAGIFLGGFLIVFLVNGAIMYLQINSLGTGSSAIDHIISRFEQRTQGVYHYSGVHSPVLEKLHLDVFFRYLGNNAFNFGFKFNFLYLLLLYIICCIFIYLKRKNDRKLMAFLCTSAVTFFAPVSWFVIFREHSHVHTHLNFVIWYVPFMIFAFAIYGIALQVMMKPLLRTNNKL